MPVKQMYTNIDGHSFIIPSMGLGDATLTPPSYTGWPTSGTFELSVEAEIIYITDASTHPWPIVRGQEGSVAASHAAGKVAYNRLTSGTLDRIVGVQQAGTLKSTSRDVNFSSGAVVTDVGGVATVAITAGMTNPMTTPADIIVGTTAGAPVRLAKGADSQLLTIDPTTHLIVWQDPTGANPMTTLDDIIVGAASGVPARLGKGTDGQVLTVDPTTHHLLWATPAFVNPMTTPADIIVATTAGAPVRLAKGSDGQVLTVDPTTHLLLWATSSSGFADPTTTKGDLIVHGASTTRIAVGTNGQVLTANSAVADGIDWETPSGGGGDTLILDYQQSADISALSVPGSTWTDLIANHNFTVLSATDLLEVSVGGLVQMINGGAIQLAQSARIVIDSGGTPIIRMLSGNNALAGGTGWPLAGAGSIAIGTLSAAVHTVKVQLWQDTSTATVYCRPGTYPNTENFRVQVIERR